METEIFKKADKLIKRKGESNMAKQNASAETEELWFRYEGTRELRKGVFVPPSDINITHDYKRIAEELYDILGLYKDGQRYYMRIETGLIDFDLKPEELSSKLMEYLFEYIPMNRKGYMALARDIHPFVVQVKQNGKYLVFNNVAYNIEQSIAKKKLIEFKGDLVVDNKFEYNYIKDAKDLDPEALKTYRTVIGNFLADIPEQKDKETGMSEFTQICGYLLSPKNGLERIFIGRSVPGTGKTTILKIFEKLYGNRASSYNPYAQDEFAEVGIYKKRFIFSGELTAKKMTRQSALQQMVSGETLSVRMNNGRVVSGENPMVQALFLTNKKLKADKEDGIGDRIEIFMFHTKIRNTAKVIANIDATIKSKEFIEVFLHFAMKGLEFVLENGLKLQKDEVNTDLDGQNHVKEFINLVQNNNPEAGIGAGRMSSLDLFTKYSDGANNCNYDDELDKKDFIYEVEHILPKECHLKVRKINGKAVRSGEIPSLVEEQSDNEISINVFDYNGGEEPEPTPPPVEEPYGL